METKQSEALHLVELQTLVIVEMGLLGRANLQHPENSKVGFYNL